MKLLSYDSFKQFEATTALSILEPQANRPQTATIEPSPISADELSTLISPFDMKRLESYAESMVDYHVVLDLIPILATLYFSNRLGEECTLSPAQRAILLALGLQRKSVDAMERELGLTSSQTLALFGKILRRITNQLNAIRRAGAGADIPLEDSTAPKAVRKALDQTIEEELGEESEQDEPAVDDEQVEALNSTDLSQ